MMPPLRVEAVGAVTAAGLTLPQSAASFVAGIDGFAEEMAPDAFGSAQVVARVPAHWRLRPDPAAWLLNLAARAGREAMESARAARTLLVCAPPSAERGHPCWEETTPDAFLAALMARLGGDFAAGARLVDGGPAALVGCLPDAADVLARGQADQILLIGVDSLLNAADMARLRAGGRLQGQTAQGLVPGEGAGAVVLSLRSGSGVVVRSIGVAREPDTVLGQRQSQGRGMLEALSVTCQRAGCPESAVEFVVSNFNGERYGALELLIYRARFYRTHRAYMATAYPAMSFGEAGSASAAIALGVATDAFRHRYAPGRCAMLEIASESGLRATAYLSCERT
jgi:3-oxoacyl-[acyl-carrier-protein] synthase I